MRAFPEASACPTSDPLWREWRPGETHSLDTAYYAEFNSIGPGTHPDACEPHMHFLTPEQAKQYAPQIYLRGMITGIRMIFRRQRLALFSKPLRIGLFVGISSRLDHGNCEAMTRI